MPDTILEQVSVIMQPPVDCGLTEDFIIPAPTLSSANSPGVVYVSFTREAPDDYATASLPCVLKFVSKEVDPATGEPEAEGYEDEYQLEEVELAAGGDYIIPSYSNFSAEWDRLRTGASITETFTLSSMESIKGNAMIISTFLCHLHALSTSGMRFYCRNPQYGTPGWVPKSSGRNDSPYAATGWFVDRGWRKDSRALPDDILKRGRSNFGGWGSWGETRSMPACDCRNWGLVDWMLCIVYPTMHRMIPAVAITQNRCRRNWARSNDYR